MKKLLAILSVVLFANQASANVEYLCNAWSGIYSNEKPFILKKENTLLKFKNYLGFAETATYIGRYSIHYSLYKTDSDLFARIYYFNDFSDSEVKELDATLIISEPDKNYEAKCYLD